MTSGIIVIWNQIERQEPNFDEWKSNTLTWITAALERENCGSGIIDGQNLLEMPSGLSAMGSDLPDYATAMTDPRFAKKPMYPVPPPPYAAVVDMVVTESETADTTRVVANGANGANGANDANAQDSPKP